MSTRDQIARLFIALLVGQTSQAFPQSSDLPPDTMAARVLACAPCHGGQGEGVKDPYFPRIAGKPSGYLFNQLVAFHDHRRRYPPMNYLLEYLPVGYLQEMADYFAAQTPPLPPPAIPEVSQNVLSHGESLVTQGDAGREIPACTSCHGPHLSGIEPGVPGLLGLHASYISAQLGAWRYGTRTAAAPDCMELVASRLTEDDVKAIAAWLSSRPVPENLSPAKKDAYALPFACGSEPAN
jgi:cytochrome c553